MISSKAKKFRPRYSSQNVLKSSGETFIKTERKRLYASSFDNVFSSSTEPEIKTFPNYRKILYNEQVLIRWKLNLCELNCALFRFDIWEKNNFYKSMGFGRSQGVITDDSSVVRLPEQKLFNRGHREFSTYFVNEVTFQSFYECLELFVNENHSLFK